MKRLIKTRAKIEPFNIYQEDDLFIVERDNVVVYKTKHQHLTTSYCKMKLAKERNEKIEQRLQEIKILKENMGL